MTAPSTRVLDATDRATVSSPPAVEPAPLRASWIDSVAVFAQLGAEWNALFARANSENIFLGFDWIFAWWRHFGKGRLAVIAVRDGAGTLCAVAPFYIARARAGLGTRRLGFLADDHVGSDHLSVLVEPGCATPAVAAIARALFAQQRRWDYIELRDTAPSPLMQALSGELVDRGMHSLETSRRVCRYVPLPGTFNQYLAGISSGLRANYRRRWRALQQEHQAEIVVSSDPLELARWFPALIALHRLRFQRRDQPSAFLAPGVPAFHAGVMRDLAARGFVRLYLLKAGGEPVAALYGFSVGRTFQFYQCGMHPDWVRYGLGQVLIGNVIEQAISTGHATFDFLRGDESYKAQWADSARQNVTLRFFSTRWTSRVARASLRVSALLLDTARNLRSRWLARAAAHKL